MFNIGTTVALIATLMNFTIGINFNADLWEGNTRAELAQEQCYIQNNWINTTNYEELQLEHCGVWEYIDNKNYTLDYVYNLEGHRLIQWYEVNGSTIKLYYSLDGVDYTPLEMYKMYPGIFE